MRPIDHADPLIHAFHRAAALPWYRTLLDEAGVRIEAVVDRAAFVARVPILSKANTFDRFPLHELAAGHSIADLAGVLTSSGHGGRFSFGLITRRDAELGAGFIDVVLDRAFGSASRRTLVVNCLPMGVTFASNTLTVATTSVREDMAVALVTSVGPQYEQIVLVADPLFMKRLLDYAEAQGVDWRRFRVQVVLGEEIFGEPFRDYVCASLGLDADRPDGGYVMSSFGVGELGLHLCHETPATIAIRRAAWRDASLARELLGPAETRGGTPAILTFEPARVAMECVDADAHGFGRMTVSMLDPDLAIPLLRYQTGDVVRILDRAEVEAALARRGVRVDGIPTSLVALRGREKEQLPNGSHVAVYKDALYADRALARHLTGAFRVVVDYGRSTLHVQLTPAAIEEPSFASRLLERLPSAAHPDRVVFWEYGRFPFGMTLDYERKFRYF